MGRGNSYHNQPRPANPETDKRNGKTASIQKQGSSGSPTSPSDMSLGSCGSPSALSDENQLRRKRVCVTDGVLWPCDTTHDLCDESHLSKYVRSASVSYPSAPSLWVSPFSTALVASCPIDTTSTCSVHDSGDVHPLVGFASPPPRWMGTRPFGPVPPDTTGRPPGLSEGMWW